jgi:RNA recognition motif. (a.k.a. RRM, RBD, or RNP domain)
MDPLEPFFVAIDVPLPKKEILSTSKTLVLGGVSKHVSLAGSVVRESSARREQGEDRRRCIPERSAFIRRVPEGATEQGLRKSLPGSASISYISLAQRRNGSIFAFVEYRDRKCLGNALRVGRGMQAAKRGVHGRADAAQKQRCAGKQGARKG